MRRLKQLERERRSNMPCRNDYHCSTCNAWHDTCCPKDSPTENINDLLHPLGGAKSSPPSSISLLCEALEIIEGHNLLSFASEELKQWHEAHDEFEKDQLKVEAAEKLSDKERRLFGIDLEALRRQANGR